jgi:PAS domain S-box-containing protein
MATEHAARALEREVGRRAALLLGLRAFAQSYAADRARLDAEFPVFATGLISSLEGVRALQLVDDGAIRATWPVVGNEAAVGLALGSHADPLVQEGFERAERTQQLSITGPVPLVQGGRGLIARIATELPEAAYPDQVATVIDFESVLHDAGFAPYIGRPRMALRDQQGDVIVPADGPLVDSVRVPVELGDGRWWLESVPEGGWGASSASERTLLRISLSVISVLLVGLGAVLSGRQQRLSRAVTDRTRELQQANHELAVEVQERESAERTLRERAEELRVALDAGRMGTWSWDVVNGRIAFNDGVAALFGRPVPDAPVSHDEFLAMLSPEDRTLLRQCIDATIEHDALFHFEQRIVLPDGIERWVYATAELQRDANNTPQRLLGVVMDVTDRTRLEEQLRQAQKMEAVGTLAGGIAHDFNNLLTAMLGFARLAHDALETSETESSIATTHAMVRDDLSELIRAGDRATMLTSQLLAFSRQQVVQSVMVDVNAMVSDLERMLCRLLDERITLRSETCAHPVVVRANAGQLSQVLLNLVVNARDAMPAGGHITVQTARRKIGADDVLIDAGLTAGEWVELSVRDDGLGMSPEIQSRIFDPFFTTKPTGKGTGLGLSTAYGIVASAGGRILVESREGSGTCMRVFLPAHARASRDKTPVRGAAALSSGHETILVVEDEPGVRRLVREILERHGYQVVIAANGLEALQILAGSKTIGAAVSPHPDAVEIDLVISDVVMPEMGGLELTMRLRDQFPRVPVLLMSGYPASEVDAPVLEEQIVAKPFTPAQLLSQVRERLNAAAAVQEVAV